MSDPLLRSEMGPRDLRSQPPRAPLGNSIKTLVAFVVLLAIGLGIWFWRRPADLTTSLGARTWIITAIDGEPVTTPVHTAPTFTLDGVGEIRGMSNCNTATGNWAYVPASGRLEFDWTSQTLVGCDPEWTETYLPESGEVSLGGGVLQIDGDAVDVVAISPADHPTATADDLAGSWTFGEQPVQIGSRGLFELGDCSGSWELTDEVADALERGEPADPRIVVVFDELEQEDCDLPTVWRDDTPFAPVVHDGVLYLRRDRQIFPVDRDVVRLDPAG